MRDENEIQQEYEQRQAEKARNHKDARGAAGAGLLGLGCVAYALLPLTFAVIVMLVLWMLGFFTSNGG